MEEFLKRIVASRKMIMKLREAIEELAKCEPSHLNLNNAGRMEMRIQFEKENILLIEAEMNLWLHQRSERGVTA